MNWERGPKLELGPQNETEVTIQQRLAALRELITRRTILRKDLCPKTAINSSIVQALSSCWS
jgi:hypothetical protein